MRHLARRLREARSVRAFSFEVSIVVVGVLIALGAQQLLDDWNWARKARLGEETLAREVAHDFFILAEIGMLQPCISAQIDQLEQRLLDTGPWTPFAVLDSEGNRRALRYPTRIFQDDAWRALASDGTVAHIAGDRLVLYRAFYSELLPVLGLYRDTQVQIVELSVLTQPIALDARSRIEFLGKLATLRASLEDTVSYAADMLAIADRLGHLPDTATTHAALSYPLDRPEASPNTTVNFCRREGYPLGKWRDALVRGREAMGYPAGPLPVLR